jgi:3-isopropylmalate/(R)-2-methylmalate dehydratase large subunit
MGMTMIEKILAKHSAYEIVRPGEIIDLQIDIRVARDLGGVNIVKQLEANNLTIADPDKTFFTFDSNTTSTDNRYAENLYKCRSFARENGIKVFDIHSGIGSHIMIDKGFAVPGSILVSTDPQVNILGAIGALGQCMGEKDLTAAFSKGKVWYRVPKTIKINLKGKLPQGLSPKDLALNLYAIFGSNKLLGCAVELAGEAIDELSIDGRISLASMASEMSAISFLMIPNQEVLDYCEVKSKKKIEVILADDDAEYEAVMPIDVTSFKRLIARPGSPFDLMPIEKISNTGIDSAFVGTSANGRIEDLRVVAGILKGRQVAPGIILKITPSTDEIWTQSLQEGLIDIFKESGAIVSNAGGGDGANDMIKQSGYGVVTISTGTKNYPGMVGHGDLYLASPAIVAASALAGFITTPDRIPDKPESLFSFPAKEASTSPEQIATENLVATKPTILKGKVWNIPFDNIDTDMIYHKRYEEMVDTEKLANHTFSQLSGYEDFASKVIAGDIVVTGLNFGLGSSRQQAVDCFKILGIQAIVAKSFAVVYERNAINAGLPIIVCSRIDELNLQTGDILMIDLNTGEIKNERNAIAVFGDKFSNIQMEIYQRGGLFNV